jgi:hypothetical protein
MNSLDYIDSIFKIALDQYQNKDEVSVEVSQSILLTVHDRIKKELNNRFYKVCMDILENNPHLANRQCYGNYILPNDKVEIKFGGNERL